MNEKNFVNYHIITSHSVSNLNRDDMGLQKTALFGGKKRIRISSQCEKRAIRTSDYYKEHFKQPSIRTRELGKLLAQAKVKLEDKFPEEAIVRIISVISGVSNIDEVKQSGAVAAWAISEIEEYCKKYQKLMEDDKFKSEIEEKASNEAVKVKNKAAKEKKEASPVQIQDIEKEAYEKSICTSIETAFKKNKDRIKTYNSNFTDGFDIALSGRMATSGIMTNVDAALAVAQAITTHTSQSDIDWFTAVDDLVELGSAHLDSQEFGSGVFYKYASLNLSQLQENLNDCNREKLLEIATHLLHLLVTVSPSAKQNSYAAFNFADFAMVTIGEQPVSLANAFEKPVEVNQKGGFLIPSIEKFIAYKKKLFTKYSLDDSTSCFNMCDQIEIDEKENEKKSIDDLKKWLQNGGK